MDEMVFLEGIGVHGAWYHAADAYDPLEGDEKLTRGEAEERGANPCPQCYPNTEYAEKITILRDEETGMSMSVNTEELDKLSDEEYAELRQSIESIFESMEERIDNLD